jgi:hypothetical protein
MKKRVKIPTKSAQMIALAMRVRQKHISDGDTSTLKISTGKQLNLAY